MSTAKFSNTDNSSSQANNNISTGQQQFNLQYQIFAENLASHSVTVLDYLALHLPQLSPTELDNWLKPLQIKLDNQRADSSDYVCDGQTLSILILNHFEQKINRGWQLLWQNDEIMAIYKPAPLAVSRTTRNLYDTLIGLIRRQTPYYAAQLLHRLDIETSGIILLTKDQASDRKWKKQLQQIIQAKVYHAIVTGTPDWEDLVCENELAERLDSSIRCKMYVVDEQQPRANYIKPKLSKTQFKLLKTQGQYSLIECRLFTGRKHQIRAQLADLGLPIVGDKIYSHAGKFFLKRLEKKRGLSSADHLELGSENHLLRAVRLDLRLTENSPLIRIESPSFNLDLRANILF
ncbi:MAG: hypothetical protein OFPII_27830 [Osedax symbiont Rs1]|nr:MAG: hypothetical protein OFPII_27830 [Osedax symbiont Rs1]